jgi:hypothetical protein
MSDIDIIPKTPEEIRRQDLERAIGESGFGSVVFWRKDVDVAHRLSDKVTEVHPSLLSLSVEQALSKIEAVLEPGRVKPPMPMRNIDEVLSQQPKEREIPMNEINEEESETPVSKVKKARTASSRKVAGSGVRCVKCGCPKAARTTPCPKCNPGGRKSSAHASISKDASENELRALLETRRKHHASRIEIIDRMLSEVDALN